MIATSTTPVITEVARKDERQHEPDFERVKAVKSQKSMCMDIFLGIYCGYEVLSRPGLDEPKNFLTYSTPDQSVKINATHRSTAPIA